MLTSVLIAGGQCILLSRFTILNLVVLVVLGKQTRLTQLRPTAQLFLFALAIFLSMTCAEVLSDWIFHEHNLKDQPTAASGLLFIDIIAIVALAFVGTATQRKSNLQTIRARRRARV